MKAIALIALLCAGAGCTATSYTGPAKAGETAPTLKRLSVFGNQSAGKVDLLKGTLEGYSSEQAEIAGAVVAAAVKAAVKP